MSQMKTVVVQNRAVRQWKSPLHRILTWDEFVSLRTCLGHIVVDAKDCWDAETEAMLLAMDQCDAFTISSTLFAVQINQAKSHEIQNLFPPRQADELAFFTIQASSLTSSSFFVFPKFYAYGKQYQDKYIFRMILDVQANKQFVTPAFSSAYQPTVSVPGSKRITQPRITLPSQPSVKDSPQYEIVTYDIIHSAKIHSGYTQNNQIHIVFSVKTYELLSPDFSFQTRILFIDDDRYLSRDQELVQSLGPSTFQNREVWLYT